MAQLPFPVARISQHWGPRDFQADPRHKGTDFAGGISRYTPVPVAADGVITARGTSAALNGWVEVAHMSGWRTRYHMLEPNTSPAVGTRVTQSQVIGQVGAQFGVSTGVHLHFELHSPFSADWTAGYGSSVNAINHIHRVPGTPPEPETEQEEETIMKSFLISIPEGQGWRHYLITPATNTAVYVLNDLQVSTYKALGFPVHEQQPPQTIQGYTVIKG